jgi:hypothetical protein
MTVSPIASSTCFACLFCLLSGSPDDTSAGGRRRDGVRLLPSMADACSHGPRINFSADRSTLYG